MSFRPTRRAAWVGAVNATGRALRRVGVTPVSLDEAKLLDTARHRTGLTDFGDDAFREPLSILLAALEQEAELTWMGRVMARREVLGPLVNRLQITDWLAREPQIGEGRIRAPIFVTGSGRSGTSLLHELLAQDPANRVPLNWEMLHPCPPPQRESHARDPRIARADRELALWNTLAPDYPTMHESGGAIPQECLYITDHAFRSDHFSGCYQVPSYARWLVASDKRPAYAFHRRFLQLLQWRCPGERWVLKAPSHLGALDALLAVYPDARIVHTHRDPVRVLASMTSLVCNLIWMRSDRVDPQRIARMQVRGVAHLLEKSMQARDEGLLAPEQVVDVLYRDLVADPVASVRRVYQRFGLELSPAVAERMRAWVAARPRGRHGEHRYRFEDTGLDLETERARFAAYRERFGVPSEG